MTTVKVMVTKKVSCSSVIDADVFKIPEIFIGVENKLVVNIVNQIVWEGVTLNICRTEE